MNSGLLLLLVAALYTTECVNATNTRITVQDAERAIEAAWTLYQGADRKTKTPAYCSIILINRKDAVVTCKFNKKSFDCGLLGGYLLEIGSQTDTVGKWFQMNYKGKYSPPQKKDHATLKKDNFNYRIEVKNKQPGEFVITPKDAERATGAAWKLYHSTLNQPDRNNKRYCAVVKLDSKENVDVGVACKLYVNRQRNDEKWFNCGLPGWYLLPYSKIDKVKKWFVGKGGKYFPPQRKNGGLYINLEKKIYNHRKKEFELFNYHLQVTEKKESFGSKLLKMLLSRTLE